MVKVRLEGSYTLSVLNNSINEVKTDIQDKLSILNKAFAVACESWQDKNAQTCSRALAEHNEVMHSALNRLESIENALNRMSQFAAEYENI